MAQKSMLKVRAGQTVRDRSILSAHPDKSSVRSRFYAYATNRALCARVADAALRAAAIFERALSRDGDTRFWGKSST
jgi:hypothetical protein